MGYRQAQVLNASNSRAYTQTELSASHVEARLTQTGSMNIDECHYQSQMTSQGNLLLPEDKPWTIWAAIIRWAVIHETIRQRNWDSKVRNYEGYHITSKMAQISVENLRPSFSASSQSNAGVNVQMRAGSACGRPLIDISVPYLKLMSCRLSGNWIWFNRLHK